MWCESNEWFIWHDNELRLGTNHNEYESPRLNFYKLMAGLRSERYSAGPINKKESQ